MVRIFLHVLVAQEKFQLFCVSLDCKLTQQQQQPVNSKKSPHHHPHHRQHHESRATDEFPLKRELRSSASPAAAATTA